MNGPEIGKLKSGTDIRGVASGIFGRQVTFTAQTAGVLARAFCTWLMAKTGKGSVTVAVGHDSRITAENLTEAVADGIAKCGCVALKTGLSSTPSMFILLKKTDRAEGSVMITASHLPADRNGMKFFTPRGGLSAAELDEIVAIAEGGKFAEGDGHAENFDFMDAYSALLAGIVRKACGSERPLEGLKIIVDAGNGAGGFFAQKVLAPLGADTEGSINLQPDGMFPNHPPNPEDRAAAEATKRAVLESGADLGIIFDTDVDRAGAVDCDGREINRNRLIALLSAVLLEERKGTIVTDSVTSDGLTEFIEAHGGRHRRYMRGYRNVIDECIRLNEAGEYSPLAIETSGHAAFKDNYFLDDGAYVVTQLLILTAKQRRKGRRLFDLIAGLKEPADEAEVRLAIEGDDFRNYAKELLAQVEARATSLDGATLPENYEGVRINFDTEHGCGWTLIRMSLHEAVLPINFESARAGGCRQIAAAVLELLQPFERVDCSPLERYIRG